MHIVFTVRHIFVMELVWGNLLRHQDILSLVIISFIIYSTLAPFYHIRSRERAKDATVLRIALQNPCFTGFQAEGLEKPNFDVIFASGIINLLFDGLTYNTADILLIARIFPHPFGARKLHKSENIRACYMLNHRIRCIFILVICMFDQ